MVKRFTKSTNCESLTHAYIFYNIILFIIIIYLIISNTQSIISNTHQENIQIVTHEININKTNNPCVIVSDVYENESNFKIDLRVEDENILKRIAMAEAGTQGIYGKALVMQVVLNRVYSEKFPNTIEKVVFQKNQFSPTFNGTYYSVKPDAECDVALDMVLNNEIESMNALYFTSQKENDTWHSRNLEYLFTHIGHKFYK